MTASAPAARPGTADLAVLVVRRGLGIGRLTDERRQAVLAVAAAALAAGEAPGERDASARLADWLQGPAACLDTDAAELRRWLVDTGWWQRDGFGRAYRRTPSEHLGPQARPWADALRVAAGADDPAAVAAWVAGRVAEDAQRRAERRQAAAGAAAR